MTEEWLPLPDAPTRYFVSNHGRVRGPQGFRKIQRSGKGYAMFSILLSDGTCKGYILHRLVLKLFVGPPPSERHQAAHKDGDRMNSHVDNLYWATPEENSADKKMHGTSTPTWTRTRLRKVGKPGTSALTDDEVLTIREKKKSGISTAEIAREFGVTWANIFQIVTGRTWRHLPV